MTHSANPSIINR